MAIQVDAHIVVRQLNAVLNTDLQLFEPSQEDSAVTLVWNEARVASFEDRWPSKRRQDINPREESTYIVFIVLFSIDHMLDFWSLARLWSGLSCVTSTQPMPIDLPRL